MTLPDHRDVRVRRAPKVGVFLGLGAIGGALVAVVIVATGTPDPAMPAPQALGTLVLALAPIGALILGAIAVVLDRLSERRVRVVKAERIGPVADDDAPRPAIGGIAAPAVEAADAATARVAASGAADHDDAPSDRPAD